MKRKLLSWVLALAMMVSLLPLQGAGLYSPETAPQEGEGPQTAEAGGKIFSVCVQDTAPQDNPGVTLTGTPTPLKAVAGGSAAKHITVSLTGTETRTLKGGVRL